MDRQHWTVIRSTIEDNGDGGVKIGLDDTVNSNRITFIRTSIRDHEIVGLNQRNGGGILLRGTANTINVLGGSITDNSALDDGGGLFIPADNTVSLIRVAVTDNTTDSDDDGGGLYIEAGATVRLWRTTIDRNLDLGDEFPNVFGSFIDFGGNTIGP